MMLMLSSYFQAEWIISSLEPSCELYILLYLDTTLINLVCNYLPVCQSVCSSRARAQVYSWPELVLGLVPGTFIQSFNKFIEHWLCARLFSRCWTVHKTDKVFCSLGAYILVEEEDNIPINKYKSGSDKCQKKIKGAKGTENDGGCYLRQDGQGKPLLIRWHWSRDPKEVREWVMWIIWRNSIPGSRSSRCKSPEVGVCLVCSKHCGWNRCDQSGEWWEEL